jgi:O-antigen/teichoic acid export membrane protein
MPGVAPPSPTVAVERGFRRRVDSWDAVVWHFGALALGEGSARLVGVAAIVLIAHRLAPSDFGVVMLGLTLSGWFSISVDSGTETLGISEVARHPERLRQIVEPILGLRLALSAASIGVFAPVAWAVAKQPGDRAILLLFAVVLPATAINLRTMVVGAGATTALGVGNVASQIAFLIGVAMFVRGAGDLVLVPVLRAAAELSYGVLIIMTLRRRYGFIRPRVDVKVWAQVLHQCAPLFANSIARVIMFSSGVLLIGFLALREEVGLYAAAHRPVVFCAAVSGLLLVSFLASYSAVRRRADAAHMFRRTVWLAATTIPLALLVSVTSSTVLTVAYGRAYVPAAPVLALLIWIVPVVLVGGPYGMALLATQHQSRLLRNNVVGAAVTVVGTLASVPPVGIMGAAVAAIAAQGVVAVLNYRASVALGVAPGLEVVALGQPWKERTS